MIKSQKSKVKSQKFLLFLLLTVYCSLLTLSLAFAEERVITMQEAYDLALTTHESIKLAQEDLHQAYTGFDKTLSNILPTVTAEAAHTQYSKDKTSNTSTIQPENSSTLSLKLSQPLYSGGKDKSVRKQARNKIGSFREGLDLAKEDIVYNVSVAYYNLLKAERDMDIKESALKRAEEQTRVAKARFKAGEVAKAIVLRAEAEAAGAGAELARSKAGLDIANTRLARLIGIDGNFKVTPPAPLSAPKDIEKLILTAFDKRKDYIRISIDEEIAKEGVAYAKGNFMPSLKFDGTYSRKDQEPSSSSLNRESIYGTITLTFPFFEGWLRTSEMKEAKSKVRQAELKRLNMKRDIEKDIREAFYNVDAVASTIPPLEKQVLYAEENYKLVFKQFKYGLATNADVVDANSTLISAQKGLSNAVYDLQLAIIELQKKSGVLMEEVENQLSVLSYNKLPDK
ncbi:MAG: TolC family protein [Deltaproteobacteria bacterium]|nr:TolC family protein [Deltaproteobacteria bacterium]